MRAVALGGNREMTRPGVLAFDVDGVLTNGRITYGPGGPAQTFDARDGAGLIELKRAGFLIALVSFRDLFSTRLRARDLGIELLMLGCTDKETAFRRLCSFTGTSPSDSLFMGDDRMDLPALRIAGFPACPADAHEDVRALCRIAASKPGGAGAVREIADLVLSGRLQ
jgi:3-deoxy-D-manno-octulosonate 8-phosphate phosphatase (KDO 8-P phosphatase)